MKCMESGYAAIINAQSLPENLKNTALLPVLQIYLKCKKQQREWKDVCPYTNFSTMKGNYNLHKSTQAKSYNYKMRNYS